MTVEGLNGAGGSTDAGADTPPAYVVRTGDTLGTIAAAHGVSLEALRAANPQILHPDLIRAGQAIHLPQAPGSQPPAHTPAAADSYVVKPGDTLSGIGAKFGLDWRIVAQANGITHPDKLQVGSTLTLAIGGAAPSSPPSPPVADGGDGPAAVAGSATQAFTPGALSARYESNGSPGTVSTGAGDAGGVSYGAYQITTANVGSFVAHEGAKWPELQGKTPGTAAFNTAWKAVAARDPAAFASAQHDYISRTHYAPQASLVLRDTGLDVGQRSHALQDVVWSTVVQHGGATTIVADAVRSVEARGVGPGDEGFDSAVIDAVYAERGRTGANGQLVHFSHNSPAVQRGVAARFVSERRQAQAELAAETR